MTGFKTALSNEADASRQEQAPEQPQVVVESSDEPKTEFTELEQEGFHIVKAILRTKVESSRLFYRDTTRYLNILLDDSIRKTICRLHLNGAKKYLGLMDESGKETKIELERLDDIYSYSDQLFNTIARLEGSADMQPA